MADPGGRRTMPAWAAVTAVLVALALGAGTMVVLRGADGDDEASPTSTTEADRTEPVELQLEPVGATGTDPFSQSVAIGETAVPSEATLVSGPDDGEVDGSTPALYGGTRDQQSCDTVALVAFLEQDQAKGAAWAEALGVEPAGIRDYVAGLTPVVLRIDTHVTNHGFRDGTATPFPAVLEAGTAVLVDAFGVPRVRCACGNPLTEPAPLPSSIPEAEESGDVVLVGETWPGWDGTVAAVVGASSPLADLTLWDLAAGGTFVVATGSAVTTTTTAPPTTRPPTTRPPTTEADVCPGNDTSAACICAQNPSDPICNPAPVDPRSDGDCRNDPAPDPEEDSGDVVCDPATGQYLCYIGPDLVPCGG